MCRVNLLGQPRRGLSLRKTKSDRYFKDVPVDMVDDALLHRQVIAQIVVPAILAASDKTLTTAQQEERSAAIPIVFGARYALFIAEGNEP